MNPFTLEYLTHIVAWVLSQLVWQGIFVTFSWKVCDRLLRSSSARLRYRLAFLHFLALGCLPVLTLGAAHLAVVSARGVAGVFVAASAFEGRGFSRPLLAGYHLFVLALPIVTVLWLAGAAAMMLCLLGSWLILCRTVTVRASAYVTGLTHDLAHELGVNPPIVVQADVLAPYVIGAKRPRIVLPSFVEYELSHDEFRSILAHELIHVRNADYFWNLIQRTFLAIFWFHPVAWFLYFRLRNEREIRCDAAAVEYCASASALAHGLLRLMETVTARSSPLALSSTEGPLETRIRSLLQSQVSRSTRGRLSFPAFAMLFSCALAIWMGERCLSDSNLRGLYKASGFGPVISVYAHDDAGSFDLQMQHGRVVRMVVEHQVVPQKHIFQTGDTVTAVGEAGQPLVSVKLDPRGGISWTPRSR